MMPTVMSAARAGVPRPERTNGLAAAPARKVRRESECVVMDKLLECPGPGGAAWMVRLLMEVK
jgi:hypothetical protein